MAPVVEAVVVAVVVAAAAAATPVSMRQALNIPNLVPFLKSLYTTPSYLPGLLCLSPKNLDVLAS